MCGNLFYTHIFACMYAATLDTSFVILSLFIFNALPTYYLLLSFFDPLRIDHVGVCVYIYTSVYIYTVHTALHPPPPPYLNMHPLLKRMYTRCSNSVFFYIILCLIRSRYTLESDYDFLCDFSQSFSNSQ